LLKLTSFIVLIVLIMDQPSTSMVIEKPFKVEDKGDGQTTNKPLVVKSFLGTK
jgi:hypothetical protein